MPCRSTLTTLRVHGAPAPVLTEVAYDSRKGSAQIDFSRTGTLVYRSGGSGKRTEDRAMAGYRGQDRSRCLEKPGDYLYPKLSPNGSRLVLGSAGDIWVYDWQLDTMTRLSFDHANFYPVWSPDGRYIMFMSAEPHILDSRQRSGQAARIDSEQEFPVSIVLYPRWQAVRVL